MNRKNIIKILFLVTLAVTGVYYYRIYGSKLIPVASMVLNDSSAPVGEDILELVQKLDYINIDNSIFASALFTNLKDFSVQVVNGEKYRPNPFAPIQGIAVTPTPTPTPFPTPRIPIRR